MADVFTVLAQDHQEVQAMLAELEKGPTSASGASEDQLALRKKMTETLIIRNPSTKRSRKCTSGPLSRSTTQPVTRSPMRRPPRNRKPSTYSPSWTSSMPATRGSRNCSASSSERPGAHRLRGVQVWPGLRSVLSAQVAGERHQDRRRQEDRAHATPSAHTRLAVGAQDHGARRGRRRQGARRGHRPRDRLTDRRRSRGQPDDE